MQITIDQNEIELAIKNHVQSMLTIKEGQRMEISLKAGRGDNGYTATIEIGDATTKTASDNTPATAKPQVVRDEEVAKSPDQEAPAPETPAPKPGLFGGLNSTRNLANSAE